MRILVTGAGGFAGQHLLRLLLAEGGHEITAGSLEGSAPASRILPAEAAADVGWVEMDVTSDASIREVVKRCTPERVYHLAGQASVGESYGDPLPTWEVNATGTLRLLEQLRRSGVSTRVLVVSSAEVYGAVPEERQPISESAPIAPLSPYGASKAATELVALQAAGQRQIEVVIARSFNHVGPGQDVRFFLPSMARQISAIARGDGNPTVRVGDLQPRRDFLDVRDGVEAYRRLMEQGANRGIYNVCSGHAYSLRHVLEELIRASGAEVRLEIEQDRIRPLEIPVLVGDPSALKALGWEPKIPIRQTLTDLLEHEGAEANVSR